MNSTAHSIVAEVLEKQMGVADEPQMLIYDRDCGLANLLADAYIQAMPQATSIDFNKHDPEDIREKLLSLPASSTVVLVQSTNFRLAEFRIRLELFNRGIGCLEHSRLAYFKPEEYETYMDALRFRGDRYKTLGTALAQQLESAQKVEVVSHGGATLTFGPMETAQVNHSIFKEQKHRGGAAICGEVFSEARDFSTVNGDIMVRAYPDENLRVVLCEPFKIHIEKSFITEIDASCPNDFKANILEKIRAGENGEVMVREAGFGLNPALSFERMLTDINHSERMEGFHMSLGKKHNIYRDKFDPSVTQRYHIDVFTDVAEIRIDAIPVFQNGHYLMP